MYHYDDHSFPCLHCHQHSYIRMVQHLIERCLILKMTRKECISTLAQHARISPVITLTVWRELVKENRGFFQAYFRNRLMGISRYNPTALRRRRRQWRWRKFKKQRKIKTSITHHSSVH